MKKIIFLLSLMTGFGLMAAPNDKESNARFNPQKLTWNSPSKNSMGAMPAGNGDMGINLWVEENGNLLFYLSKTDACSENGGLLKLGKVRMALNPNPFAAGNKFKQELVLEDGVISIKAGEGKNAVEINCWVDANNPVVEFDIESQSPIAASCTFEPWRIKRRALKQNAGEIYSVYGLHGKGLPDVIVEKDSVCDIEGENIVWLHRNKRSIWKDNLELQALGDWTETHTDPLLNRTFGGFISSDKLQKTDKFNLKTSEPQKAFSVSVYALTQQTETAEEWIEAIQQQAKNIESQSRKKRLSQHKLWWNEFWQRSYINVSTQNEEEKIKIELVTQGYALQRYMYACSGRGNLPIKHNGSIFIVDTKNLAGRYSGYDADFRLWGGPYWWQNTRFPYWAMLEAGDHDMILPLFKMYRDALDIRKLATQKYYQHDGAFFPETIYFWGTYVDDNYGRDRSKLPLGTTKNRYVRYYWQGGLELSLMMLDYYSFTQDEKILKETILPFVTEIMKFFDNHWGRDENGKILFDPAIALETYNTAVNPSPEIVGITKICNELLRLPESVVPMAQKKQCKRLITEMPQIPTRIVDGQKILAPAQTYSGMQNHENPELYAVFPYRTFGIEKEGLEMARKTYAKRIFKETGGWGQSAIQAAYLGLEVEASKLTTINFNTSNKAYRFPAMWGYNGIVPHQCHGNVAVIALQRMLVQYDGDKIYLLPAWPKEWDVDFRLHTPQNTTIAGEFKNGKITSLKVTPKEREKDITNRVTVHGL